MKKLILVCLLFAQISFAGEGHDKESPQGEHHEEANSGVGPDKGITEKNEKDGFKLSPEAMKTIAFQTINYQSETFEIAKKALVQTKDDKSIFRLRDGWLKRIDVQVLRKNQDSVLIKVSEFKVGDKIVVSEVGYLRMVEVFTEEGAEHSH